MELSALKNVNVAELLYLVAAVVDKHKPRPKIPSYSEAEKCNNERIKAIRFVIFRCLRMWKRNYPYN